MGRVQALVRAEKNDLRIGYSSFLNTKMLEVIRRTQPEAPGSVSVKRKSVTTQLAVSGVLKARFHVGFGILPIADSDISSRLLLEEPLNACLPVGRRLTAKRTIQPEDLENEPLVSVSKTGLPGHHRELTSYFESLGISLNFETDAYSAKEALWLVAKGVGVSLLTRSTAFSYRHEVIIRPLSDRLVTMKSGAFTRRDQDQKLVRDFVELMWAETATLRSSPQ